MTLAGITAAVRGQVRQAWRDLLSVYYANTPTWRWLKSGALVFFGFFLWMGGAVVFSVQPGWGFLTYVMAYGFLLLVWGPFTHLVVVPVTIRLRRTAEHPLVRSFSRNSGKINLSIFFALVIIVGTIAPPVMLLEFSPGDNGGENVDIGGDLQCDTTGDPITCEVVSPEGFDHVTVESGGETVATADSPPYAVSFDRGELRETRTGREFRVQFRDESGDVLREFVRQV
jgi:hypothetical protein